MPNKNESKLVTLGLDDSKLRSWMLNIFSDVEQYRKHSKEKDISLWVEKEITELPENCPVNNKKYMFFQYAGSNIAYSQMYINYKYPNIKNEITTISLFLLKEKFSNQGLGSIFLKLIMLELQSSYKTEIIRLAVDKNNEIGTKFWTKNSFFKVEETENEFILEKSISL